jgi:hypothetical protein
MIHCLAFCAIGRGRRVYGKRQFDGHQKGVVRRVSNLTGHIRGMRSRICQDIRDPNLAGGQASEDLDCGYTATQGKRTMTAWRQWLQHPERSWLRNAFFQIHLWVGAGVGVYILVMSISGSMIVYRDELSRRFSVEWLVNFHENLLSGSTGRLVNGIGALCVLLLCLTGAVIWWPGTKNWRRSLTVNWRAHFARISWDLHSALGFWCFFFILVWGVSGVYFSFPQPFNALLLLDPRDRFTDQGLFWLSQVHLAGSAGLPRLFGLC